MKKQKLNLNFNRLNDADFLNKAQYIQDCMTGNPDFPDPVPTMAELKTAITNYSAALALAAGLGKVNVAGKNECRQQLDTILYQLGMFVMYIAVGNIAILTRSGFTLAKDPEPMVLENPGLVQLSNGITSGQLIASVPSQRAAKSYLYQLSEELPTDNTVWTSTPTVYSKYTFSNLKPGKQYWIRVCAVGNDDQLAYSPVSSQYVQ